MLLPLIRLERTSLIVIASTITGISAFWFAIVTGVMIFIPNAGSVPLMLHWLLSFFAMLITAIHGTALCHRFLSQGVRMGQTRKTMLTHLSVLLSILVLIQYLLINLFCAIEEYLVYNVWMKMQDNLIVELLDRMDAWWATPVILALGVVVALVGGALFLKFGARKATWVFAIVWFGFIGLSNSDKLLHIDIHKTYIGVFIVALCAVSLIWAIYHYLHMSVNQE